MSVIKQEKNIIKQSYLVALLMIIASPAFADLQGGLNKAESYADIAQTSLMTIGGIVAAIYLLWKALECWRGRADWGEFGMAIVYVGLAGGSAVLARWAWTMFTT